MTTNTRIDLKVPYAEKNQAKVHGAQWDTENRTWYAPPGTDLENLKRQSGPKKVDHSGHLYLLSFFPSRPRDARPIDFARGPIIK